MKEYLLQLARYNNWANEKMINWCCDITEEHWLKNLGGSMPSLSETCIHIAGAETLWYQRLLGLEQNFQAALYKGPGKRNEVMEIWKKASAVLCEYVDSITEENLVESFDYKNMKGDDYSSLRLEALAHVFNHSTYHRGQIVNYLRQLGYESVSSTDLISFFRI